MDAAPSPKQTELALKGGSTRENDHVRVLRYAEILFDADEYRSCVIDGNPPSKARPRFGKNRNVYTPSSKAEKKLSWLLKYAFPAPLKENVFVICIFFRGDKHRIDSDNMMKHFLDAATGVCWNDDSQVTAHLGIIEYDPARPRTVVLIGRHESSMVRVKRDPCTCLNCGKIFETAQHHPPKYCSRACAAHSRGLNLLAKVPCARCGIMFKRISAARRFCSNACRIASLNDHSRRWPSPPTCSDCGSQVSKRGYGRCRACWRKQPGLQRTKTP